MLNNLKKSIAIALAAVTITANTANAYAISSATFTGNIVTNIYDAKVIAEMIGRPGAALDKGAKGIAFEVLFKDKLNLQHLFDKNFHAVLNPNPIDELADILVYNRRGEIVTTYQCKTVESSSGIKTLIEQIKSEKYSDTNLVATSESAKLIKEALKDERLDVNVIDSNISSETANRIADKALAKKLCSSPIVRSALKIGVVSGGLEAIFAAYDAFTRGMGIDESISHTSIKAIEGFTAGTISGFIIEFAGAGLTTVAAPAATIAVIPVVVGTASYFLITNLTEKAVDMDVVEARAASFINVARIWLMDNASSCVNTIKGVAKDIRESVSNKADQLLFSIYGSNEDSGCPWGHQCGSDYICNGIICRSL